jgi:hypothetical protein
MTISLLSFEYPQNAYLRYVSVTAIDSRLKKVPCQVPVCDASGLHASRPISKNIHSRSFRIGFDISSPNHCVLPFLPINSTNIRASSEDFDLSESVLYLRCLRPLRHHVNYRSAFGKQRWIPQQGSVWEPLVFRIHDLYLHQSPGAIEPSPREDLRGWLLHTTTCMTYSPVRTPSIL